MCFTLGESFRFVTRSFSDTEPCQIVILSLNGELRYSRNRSIANEFNIPSHPTDLTFSPDGRHLLTANSNGTVYILRLSKLATQP